MLQTRSVAHTLHPDGAPPDSGPLASASGAHLASRPSGAFSAQCPPAGQAKLRAIVAPSLCRCRGGSARIVQRPHLRSRGLVADLGALQLPDALGVMSCQKDEQQRARSSKGRGGGPQGQGSGWECAKRATGSRRHRRRRPQEGGGRKSPSSAEEG